ncbi:MAG: hypothetical protein ACHQ01_01760 [Candidatus Limnocylindrales bacterium]
MSDPSYRAPHDELSSVDDEVIGDGARVDRRRLVPPILSLALVVAAVAGLAGVGLGYRLGQASLVASAAPTAPAIQLPNSGATVQTDLHADTVSERLSLAYQAASSGSWAICDLGATVVCRALEPSLSVSPAVHHTFGFTNSDMAALGQPTIEPGHVVLAAGLGEGAATGSLIALDATIDQVRSHPLTPIDPGRLGVDYFDLGLLDSGTYGIVLGFIPQTGAETSAPILDSYLASFAVTG